MGKASRVKGATTERQVAGMLTEWCGHKVTRVPMSGGYNKLGDLTPKDPEVQVKFPFNFEVKAREAWDLYSFLFSKSKEPWNWWEQCTNDARISSRLPILVFKQNLRPWLSMTYLQFIISLPDSVEFTTMVNLKDRHGKELVITRFDELLKHRFEQMVPIAYKLLSTPTP